MIMKFSMQVKPLIISNFQVRYKIRKSTDGKASVQVPPENRDNWLILFNVVGLTLPKYGVPPLKPKPILANSETSNLTFHPKINKIPEAVSIEALFNF